MGAHTSWDALRVLVAVVRAGSFSAAADELGLAQSTVSESVARLERDLGYRLLDRSRSGVTPTVRGQELVSRIAGAIDELTSVTSPVDASRENRTVFIGGPAEFLSEMILPRLSVVLPDDLHLVAQFGLADELADALRRGAVDVLVSARALRGPGISIEPIYDEQFVLVAHPRWVERAAGDLDAVPVLSYGPELPIIRRYWRAVFGRRPTALRATMIAPDLRALRRLAVDGAGMTVLPEYLVHEQLSSGALVRLHRPEIAPLNTLVVATRTPVGQPDPAVQWVRQAVVDVARDSVEWT